MIMNKYILHLATIFFIIGCGSDSSKYTVTDDGNGTHSPRIVKVVVRIFDDNNTTTEKYHITYSYNKENLLIEKKEIDEKPDIDRLSRLYTYNNLKQIIYIDEKSAMFVGGYNKFLYKNKIIYAKTKFPILRSSVDSFSVHGAMRTVQTDYKYIYNDDNEAIQLESSYNTLTGSTIPNDYELMGTILKSVQYMYDNNGKIIQETHTDSREVDIKNNVIKKYIYDNFGRLSTEYINSTYEGNSRIEYFYNDKYLLISSKKYYIEKSGSKRLLETKKYSYENKPYYSNPSPNHLDQGQYSSSGIY